MRSGLRFALAAAMAAALETPAASGVDRPVLLLSAFPTEQAKLLASAAPVAEAGVFNGRRFFAGTIAGKSVVMGLTGIGTVNARDTTRAALDFLASDRTPAAIVFCGVAGGGAAIHIGDVTVPDRWSDGSATYAVDPDMYAVAAGLVGAVKLDDRLPVGDAACSGFHPDALRTPIRVTGPVVRPGGLGFTSDPYAGRAVPCLSSAGDLLGCEACGAPPSPSPGAAKFASESAAFADPFFLLDLFRSFSSPPPAAAVVVDMETASVAALAAAAQVPFIAFRAISDGGGDPLMLPGFPFQFFVYQELAADNAAAAVLEFLRRWTPAP